MALTLEGYLALRRCCGEFGFGPAFRQLSLREPELVRGLLAMGSMLFQQQRFNDALQLMQVAMDAGLDAPDLPEGQARALVRLGRYREAETQLLELLRQAEGRRCSGLEKVLRVCRHQAEQQQLEADQQLILLWRARLVASAPLEYSAINELAQSALGRPNNTPIAQLFDEVLTRQLSQQDPHWDQWSARVQRWMVAVERQEWWLQLLAVD